MSSAIRLVARTPPVWTTCTTTAVAPTATSIGSDSDQNSGAQALCVDAEVDATVNRCSTHDGGAQVGRRRQANRANDARGRGRDGDDEPERLRDVALTPESPSSRALRNLRGVGLRSCRSPLATSAYSARSTSRTPRRSPPRPVSSRCPAAPLAPGFPHCAALRGNRLCSSRRLAGASAQGRIPRQLRVDDIEIANGLRPSPGSTVIEVHRARVRSTCLRKRMPRPAPCEAPGMRPGMSARTKLASASKATTPRCGTSVVNGYSATVGAARETERCTCFFPRSESPRTPRRP